MSNQIHLSAQLAHLCYILSLEDPAACQQVWAVALHNLDPKGIRALSEAMPPAGAVAQSLRDSLSSLAMERATSPQEAR